MVPRNGLEPDDPWGYSLRSYLNYATGKSELALEDIDKAIELDPLNAKYQSFKEALISDATNFPQSSGVVTPTPVADNN